MTPSHLSRRYHQQLFEWSADRSKPQHGLSISIGSSSSSFPTSLLLILLTTMSFYTPSVAVDPLTSQHTSQALVLANKYVPPYTAITQRNADRLILQSGFLVHTRARERCTTQPVGTVTCTDRMGNLFNMAGTPSPYRYTFNPRTNKSCTPSRATGTVIICRCR